MALDLTPSQQQAVAYLESCHKTGDRGFLWWSGGVRAGKSFGAMLLCMMHMRRRHGLQGMILGYTQAQLIQIFGRYAEVIAEEWDVKVKLSRSTSNPRISFPDWNVEVLLRGADKVGRDKSIQGLTMDFLLVDEVPLLNKDALHQAEARLSGRGAFRVYTSNKQSPHHWTVKYYLRRMEAGTIPGKILDCGISENPHVDSSYAAERAGEFTGNTLKRFIDNEYSLDAPPLYVPKTADKAGMRMPCPKQHVRHFTALCGHQSGVEAIMGRYGALGKNQLLAIDDAFSVAAYTDLDPTIIGDPKRRTVLVNMSQGLLARWLRRRRYRIRGYRDDYVDAHRAIMQAACGDGQLRISEDAESMLEAVECYHEAGEYTHPIIMAFEALACMFKYTGLSTLNDVSTGS